MKKTIILCLLLTIILLPVQAEAFWWLFGKTKDEVNLTYLYINGISYDESGEEITLYRDLLAEGFINIRGRAVIRNGQIGSVLISVDGKENWESAELSEDGAFQYYFRPELGQSYDIYIEAMETAGRINDVDASYKRVTVSESNYQQVINERLAELFAAYEMRDSSAFMDYVSWDFVGSDIVLEQAINKDFRNFADIEIDYNIVNMAVNNEGMLSTVIEYRRRLIANNDGSTLTDSGITEFIFNLEDRGPVLYSMSHPLIFGVSDAVNVASGAINSAENDEVIAVDGRGNLEYKTMDEIIYEEEIDESGEKEEPEYRYGQVYLSYIVTENNGDYSTIYQGYNFSLDTVLDTYTYPGGQPDVGVGDDPGAGDGEGTIGYTLVVMPDIGHIMLAESNIDNVTEVPADGYSYEIHDYNGAYRMEPGKCYALKLRDGNYAVVYFNEFEIVIDNEATGEYQESTTLYYKYRDDGGRQF